MAEAFTIKGKINGADAQVSWADGVFDSDDARHLVDTGASIAWTPTGPWVKAAASPAPDAFMTALSLFDSRATVELDDQGKALAVGIADELAIPSGALA